MHDAECHPRLAPVWAGPVLPPAALPAAVEAVPTEPLELPVPGSGVYAMEIRNTNFFSSISFSAKVEHEPTTERQRKLMRLELEARKGELTRVAQQDAELSQSEAALAQRLWEVQETRRRHMAMKVQLEAAVESVQQALAEPLVSPSRRDSAP